MNIIEKIAFKSRNIFLMSYLLSRGFASARNPGDLNQTQEKALVSISVMPGKTLKELQQEININMGAFSRVIQSLIQLEYVTKKVSESDRRKIYIELTARGEEEVERIYKKVLIYFENILSTMPPEKVEAFYESLLVIEDLVHEIRSAQ